MVPTASATAATWTPADDPKAGMVSMVCARRAKPCTLVTEHHAGTDAKGRALSVALFLVGYPERDAGDGDGDGEHDDAPGAAGEEARGEASGGDEGDTATAPVAAPRDTGISFTADGETFSADGYGSCFAYEYWRVVRDGGHLVESDRIAAICNDGNGAAGVGEDSVKVAPNSVEIASSGGSAWRWSESATYSLSPFVRTAQSSGEHWSVAFHRQESQVDWKAFSGGTEWTGQACGPGGEPSDEEDSRVLEYAYDWIPSVPLDPAFLASGWKTTELGACAASLETSGHKGHVVSGRPRNGGKDARVRVLAARSGELFVEIRDPEIHGPSARPATDDHVEVWSAPALPAWDSRCIDPKSSAGVVSWDVRIADGKVTPGFGKPTVASLVVERAADATGAVRLRLVVPQGQHALTIAYADSEVAGKIARRVATSRLVDGQLATLGHVSNVDDHARCIVQNGALVPELLRVPEKVTAP